MNEQGKLSYPNLVHLFPVYLSASFGRLALAAVDSFPAAASDLVRGK
ncbi:hypothetical protein [Paenibacillus sp. 22594]